MPRGDGTGPEGMGSRTGRGAGYCSGFSSPGYMNQGPGRGSAGRGSGAGRGYRNRFWQSGMMGMLPVAAGWFGDWMHRRFHSEAGPRFGPANEEDELQALKSEIVHYERVLDEVRKRIDELESKMGEKE